MRLPLQTVALVVGLYANANPNPKPSPCNPDRNLDPNPGAAKDGASRRACRGASRGALRSERRESAADEGLLPYLTATATKAWLKLVAKDTSGETRLRAGVGLGLGSVLTRC